MFKLSKKNTKSSIVEESKSTDPIDKIHEIDVKEELEHTTDIESAASSLPPDIEELPRVVREVVDFDDDANTPLLTFRYFLLSIIFIPPGAFIDTFTSFRTTSAAYSIFFVQLASHWLGMWLAKVLPDKKIGFGKFKFSLNPGPWSIKETVLVTITASSGATGSLATNCIALAEVYYDTTISPAVCIFFMWAIVFLGYSYSGISRNFLINDPQFIWPQALMQTTLFQNQKKSHGSMQVFFVVLIGVCFWTFLPEYVFPMTSSLALLCWCAPENYTANFIGSGLGGMGFLNISLDWSNITSSIMLSPYWVHVVQFLAFILGAWILIPATKWGNLGNFQYGLMSNNLFMSNGTKYPTTALLTPDHQLNMTAYKQLGPVHLGTQRAWNIFFDYAAFVSGFVWAVLFGYKSLKESVIKFYAAKLKSKSNTSSQYTDRLNKIQSKYADVPLWWFLILFICTFIILIVTSTTNALPIPWWTVFVAMAIGAVIVTPLSWLYAISNFQLAVGTFNEVIYGYMIEHMKYKVPYSVMIYSSISGDAFYRAQYESQSLKIGHYNHIPPRVTFFCQIFGEIVGVPINYAALKWVLKTKKDYLNGTKVDKLHQWTGQTLLSYHSNVVQYVTLGPSRLFENYRVLPYGFLVGLIAPIIFYSLHRLFPNSKLKFRLRNTTIFFSTMSTFYGNISTGYFSQFVGATVTMFYFYRYRHNIWKKYNYLLGAAFDTGFNLSILLIFIIFSAGKTIDMPNWWGNNDKSVERCFALVEAD
ncbi:unnamed protein product [Candida verbasci]|uniref:Oligopeptide transporter n=1 Tax=Candida verbasci TaxID=1227364 RepID=A0A9W4TWF8_9ASCO|nr:unnamed protein product [Candida verbasci]